MRLTALLIVLALVGCYTPDVEHLRSDLQGVVTAGMEVPIATNRLGLRGFTCEAVGAARTPLYVVQEMAA
jgi:hypothetical protein